MPSGEQLASVDKRISGIVSSCPRQKKQCCKWFKEIDKWEGEEEEEEEEWKKKQSLSSE